jgi:hypothetical protein
LFEIAADENDDDDEEEKDDKKPKKAKKSGEPLFSGLTRGEMVHYKELQAKCPNMDKVLR